MEICLPSVHSGGVGLFTDFADLQNQIRCSSDNAVIVYIPSYKFLNDRTNLFLLVCLSALVEQCQKKMFVEKSFDVHFRSDEFIRFFQLNETTEIINLVRNVVSGNISVDTTDEFEEELISLIAEIFNNAREHSKTNNIMGICYKPQDGSVKDKLCFCCYDTGIGIIGNVRHHLIGDDATPIFKTYGAGVYFMQWALASGNSTETKFARGLGLNQLLEFSKKYRGFFRICNEDVLFEQNSAGEQKFKKLNSKFFGSFFELHITEQS